MASPEDVILDYHDVLLRREDFDLIWAPKWLNDQVIAFYFEYLSRHVYADSTDILFIPGATTYLLLTAGSSVASVVLDPLGFSSMAITLFAVNNNPDASVAGGGSHWSLCTYTQADSTLRHFDSCGCANEEASRALYDALSPALPPDARLLQAPCPQQQNGYDCGMVVLELARIISARFRAAQDGGSDPLSFEIIKEAADPAELDDARAELRSIILGLAEEHKRLFN